MKTVEVEYANNNEGCYLLRGKIKEKNMWFDATRKFDQYGRYINHSTDHNIKPIPPVFVHEKWRIGFLATKDIKPEEELLYDYGVRDDDIPCLR